MRNAALAGVALCHVAADLIAAQCQIQETRLADPVHAKAQVYSFLTSLARGAADVLSGHW